MSEHRSAAEERSSMDRAPCSVAVLIPVKAFSQAKRRLAPVLDPVQRAALARAMATSVINAAAPLPVAVVCDDSAVARWALGHGAKVVWAPGQGLNHAVQTGVRALCRSGANRVIVAHSDLPLVPALAPVADFDGVTLAPDSEGGGTNVICVPAASPFEFAYGPGSFRRHYHEARRLGLDVRVLAEPGLARDIDHPRDLAAVGVTSGMAARW